MAKRFDAASFAAKYKARATAAAGDYAKACATTDKDPTELAAAAEPKYQQKLQESFSRNSFSKGLRKAGKAKWQAGIKKKGEANYRQGIDAGTAAWQAYMATDGQQVAQEIAAKMSGMANVSEADADARALAAIQIQRDAAKRRKGA